jgi:hypothetical protein
MASEPTSGEGAVPVPNGLLDHNQGRGPADHGSALDAARAWIIQWMVQAYRDEIGEVGQ